MNLSHIGMQKRLLLPTLTPTFTCSTLVGGFNHTYRLHLFREQPSPVPRPSNYKHKFLQLAVAVAEVGNFNGAFQQVMLPPQSSCHPHG